MNTSVRLDSTTICDIRLKYRYSTRPESNIGPLFDLLFDPEYWPYIEYFSNSEAGSSYSPKFASDQFKPAKLKDSC